MPRITPKLNKSIFTEDILKVLPTNDAIKRGVANKEKWDDPEYRNKIVTSHNSEEYVKQQSLRSKRKWKNPIFKKKREKSLNAWAKSEKRREQVSKQMANVPKTKKHCEKLSQSQKEFYETPEGKKVLEQKAAKQRGKPKPKFTCPYCKEVGGPIMKRWHFDNCKQKGENK
jgi:hypothetical protein